MVIAASRDHVGQATAQENKTELPPDLARIQSASFFIGSANVGTILNSEAAKGVREQALKTFAEPLKELEKEIGVGLLDIERITMAMPSIGPNQSEPVVIVATKNAIEPENVLRLAMPEHTEKSVDNAKIYVAKGRERKAISFLDSKAYAFGPPDSVEQFVTAAPPAKKAGPLTPVLNAIASGKHAVVAGINPDPLNALVDQLGAEAEPFKPLIAAKSSLITMDLTNKLTIDARGTFADAKDAEKAEKSITELRTLLLGIMGQGIQKLEKQGPDWAKIVDLLKQAETTVKDGKIQRKDAEIQISMATAADIAKLNAALIEAVSKIRDSAARIQSMNNLKQIALSFHNYMDSTGAFPTNVLDKNGKPMLSWRVMILPYLEQDNLYKQFHLDEPWDSEHNKKLIDQMPATYLVPGDDAKKHLTRYVGFSGKGALFDGATGKKITDVTDGTSNTIMVVEGAKGVIWSKPDDIPFGDGKLVPLVANPKKGGFNAAYCDGSVRFLKNTIKEETLRALITIAGGEVIPADADD
jgi:prepilin-type processing-associated H-X9-DG protein